MSSNHFNFVFGSFILFLCAWSSSHADVIGDFEVHGFITQGYIETTDNRFFGDSENGSTEFRELGINVSYHVSDNLRLAGQLLSRRAGSLSDGDVDVDFVLADITIHSDTDSGLGVLIGRIKNPLGLFNETRDIAFTRPGVFIPQVIYYDKVRDLILSADGIGVRSDLFGERANLSLYLGVGSPIVDENAEHGFLGAGFSGDLKADGLAYLGRILVETPDNSVRASFSLSRISMEFERELVDPIGDGFIDSYYGILSLQVSGEDWTFTTEYMREPTEWRGFSGSLFDELNTAAEGYYAQLAWSAKSDVELMLRYGEGFAERDDRGGKDFSAATFGSIPAHTRYSKILTIGARWDATDNLMFRAEYQRHNGTFILSSRENPDPRDLDPDWDLFAIEASYRF